MTAAPRSTRARPPGRTGGSGAGFTGGGGDRDVAAEADDVVEIQLLGQHPVEFLVAEAAIGDNAHLDVGRQQFGEPHRRGAGVDDDGAAVGQLVQRGAGDALFLVDRVNLTVGDARLDAETLDRDGSPVHPP